ncbi:hypothetical protein Scep_021759 [Stephania cephalantha]|uniref:Uncharacterized protein n=1 Tax=Stephania cephalantha TaxID=152367 RepID=A0AAP0F6L6_9MAGN
MAGSSLTIGKERNSVEIGIRQHEIGGRYTPEPKTKKKTLLPIFSSSPSLSPIFAHFFTNFLFFLHYFVT